MSNSSSGPKTLAAISGVLLLASAGCFPTLTTMQRTGTVHPGQVELGVAAGVMVGAADDDDPATEEKPPAIVPHAELAARYGLLERVDVGARLGLVGFPLLVDAKLQLLRGGPIELAVAPGVGMSLLQLLDTKSKGGGVLHFYLPVVAGVRLGEHRLLFGAKYVGTWMELVLQGRTSQVYVHLPGVMLGADVAFGASSHFLPELDVHCVVADKRLCFLTGSLGAMF